MADNRDPGDSAAPRAYSIGAPPPEGVLRLHLNEFRYDHHSDVVAAARAATRTAADLLTNYQSGPSPRLVKALADYVRANSADNILVAPGSDEVLRAVIDTSPLRGQSTVLMGVPGYTHFEHYAALRGLKIVTYPIGLATSQEDHEAALRYHTDLLSAGCLVYLGSPNNPTGDMWSRLTVTQLALEYPKSLFLIDEAYVEFASVEDASVEEAGVDDDDRDALNRRSIVPVALTRDNVVVARTMSKAFGLAALRIGYAVGRPNIIAAIGIAVSPKAFSAASMEVACVALANLAHYRAAATLSRVEAARTVRQLKQQGWWALGTPGNFYLVYVGDGAQHTVEVLASRGVQVRNRDELPGLSGFVRITAGTFSDSAAVLAAFTYISASTRSLPPARPPQTLYTNKGTVAEVKTLMRRALAALREAGVEVFAQSGTMLGMYRHKRRVGDKWHGGMIPTDDDGDLAYVRAADGSDPLAGHVALFAEAGLTLQRNRTDAYWQVGTNAPGATISPVHIDVFSYSGSPAAGYALDDPRFREEEPGSAQAHCNTRYAHDELYPLSHEYLFYDMPIPMPAKSGEVLERALGADYMWVMRVRHPAGLIEVHLNDYTYA